MEYTVPAKLSKPPKENPLGPYSLGLKMRALRIEKGLTLRRLGNEVDLSTALLSKLETDRMVPTLPTLARLCRVYGVGLGYFFSDPTRQTISITRREHMAQEPRGPDLLRQLPLHMPTADSKLVAKLVDIPPGRETASHDCSANTEFMVYVLEGILSLSVAGSEDELRVGDCAIVASDSFVVIGAAGKSHCRLLCITPNPSLEYASNKRP